MVVISFSDFSYLGESMIIIDFHVEIGNNDYYNTRLDIDTLLKIMDEYNVGYCIITPAYGTSYIYDFDKANREIYHITKNYRRLLGFATVNPWFLHKSLNELEKAIKDYKLPGVKLIPYLQGFSINHKIIHPIMEYISKHKIILYVLSGYHPQSPLEIADLADMFPEVNIVMGFAGFTDFWMEVLPAMRKHTNILADISCQSNVRAIEKAIKELGSERFLFASSAPCSDIEVELEKVKMLSLDEYSKENILWRNAKKLLKLP